MRQSAKAVRKWSAALTEMPVGGQRRARPSQRPNGREKSQWGGSEVKKKRKEKTLRKGGRRQQKLCRAGAALCRVRIPDGFHWPDHYDYGIRSISVRTACRTRKIKKYYMFEYFVKSAFSIKKYCTGTSWSPEPPAPCLLTGKSPPGGGRALPDRQKKPLRGGVRGALAAKREDSVLRKRTKLPWKKSDHKVRPVLCFLHCVRITKEEINRQMVNKPLFMPCACESADTHSTCTSYYTRRGRPCAGKDPVAC